MFQWPVTKIIRTQTKASTETTLRRKEIVVRFATLNPLTNLSNKQQQQQQQQHTQSTTQEGSSKKIT